MSNKKITNAMQYLDDSLIEEAATAEKVRKVDFWGGKGMKKLAAIAAVFVVILAGALVLGKVMGSANSIVAFDVNPSIEIEINKNEKVVDVDALNRDAEIVLEGMELEGVDLEVAVNAIIGSMLKHGYLSTEQNSILVSVDTRSGKISEELRAKLTEKIEGLLGGENIEASVITQTFDKNDKDSKAEENNISRAKAALISRILKAGMKDANGNAYTFEQLAALKVNELKLMLESKSIKVDGIVSSGLASEGAYIGSEEAVRIAYAKANLTASDISRLEVEMDFEMGRMVYEIDFKSSGMEYEYEIDAATGEIVKEEVELDDGDDEDDRAVLPEGSITEAAALDAVYAHASVDPARVTGLEIKTESKNGRVVFEIEFEYGRTEYEYKVDVLTGEIVEADAERD